MGCKKQCCKDDSGDIPSWFMTYSDVITLLMTFFILLLTFSTNEPEFFSKVQVVAFGGGGTEGMAAKSDTFVDANVPVLRHRPNAARLTTTGSETPPMETNPATETLAKGLQALQETSLLADAERIRIQSPVSIMRQADGLPTEFAIFQIERLAPQLISMPLELTFRAGSKEDAEFCVSLAVEMYRQLNVPLGRVSIAEVDPASIGHGQLEMVLTRQDMNATR